MNNETQHRLTLTSTLTPAGRFEIHAITAGIGNGWNFPAETLQQSLPLWNNVKCYLDHSLNPHSIRDLAGICSNPRWNTDAQAITLDLTPIGPGAQLLAELGAQLLAPDAPPADVGFSADLLFSAEGKTIKQIVKVFSVDLVLDPARGGAFVRALNSIHFQTTRKETQTMPTSTETNPTPAEQPEATPNAAQSLANALQNPPLSAQLSTDLEAIRTMLGEQARQQALADEAEKARQVRAQMCNYLLESALTASKLPAPVAARVRNQFAGKVFEAAELETAIQDARALVSEMNAATTVIWPAGAISAMFSSEDQITAAIHDLLGIQRPAGLETLRAAKLSGIREIYTRMTGDTDFTGGYHPDRIQLSTTASLPAILKNALNKMIVDAWADLGRSGYRWWEPLVQVIHFNSLQPITGILVGEIALLPSVSEGAAYTELSLKDSEETGTWAKYGGYVGLTLEMFERDETHRLKQYPHKLASSAMRRISNLVGSIFTANSGVGPVMTDTYNVFDAAHHANLGTASLSGSAFDAASKSIYNQSLLMHTSGSASPAKLALDAKYLVVPRDLRLTAARILYPSFEREANIFSENMQKGQMGDVITSPEFTDADDWAALADPTLAPGIILAERFGLTPEIFISDSEQNGALFTNDEIRMKVRHWVSCFVADYRPLYKSNVA